MPFSSKDDEQNQNIMLHHNSKIDHSLIESIHTELLPQSLIEATIEINNKRQEIAVTGDLKLQKKEEMKELDDDKSFELDPTSTGLVFFICFDYIQKLKNTTKFYKTKCIKNWKFHQTYCLYHY